VVSTFAREGDDVYHERAPRGYAGTGPLMPSIRRPTGVTLLRLGDTLLKLRA
jgi:hypothetical protein